jgi:adenosylcobinamide kinase/adenosylcobinamide-phosphate guanylyltransferase
MGKLTFILGGARSGKSSYAQGLAERSSRSVVYIATAQAGDDEMTARIAKHRAERPAEWATMEIQRDVASFLTRHPAQAELYLLDCVTLLTSNVLLQYSEEEGVSEQKAAQAIQAEIDGLLAYIRAHEQEWIIISNEVGLGIVPYHSLGRIYRDLLGMVNRRLAAAADEVLWMAAGIPVPIGRFRG